MLRRYEYRRALSHYQGGNQALFVTFTTHHRWHLPAVARDVVLGCCRHVHDKHCHLHGAVVMPDHVHLLLLPLHDSCGPISIPEILQPIKSESTHRINRLLNRRGRVWQDESFDHVLRREERIDATLEYMMQNPVRAGLVTSVQDYGSGWRRRNWFSPAVSAGESPAPTLESG